MADYLATYAESLELPVRTGVRVDAVTREGGGYLVTAGDLRFEAANVVVATGAFDVPSIPDFAGELDAAIVQIHSNDYRSPAQLREGRVLVVGAAHSGSDIAFEVATAGHETILSGRDTGQIPAPIESRRARPILSVLRFVWTRVLTMDTPIGRKASRKFRAHGGPLLRIRRAELAMAGVERVHERTVGTQGGLPVLDGGRVMDVANVVWCTGFRPDYSWIDVPLDYEDGYPRQYRGVVDSAPGLYFVGLPFLHSFSSMLVLGAGRDGEWLAEHIAATAGERRPAAEPKADAVLSR
jgi:putative flavoprotein involved in K+ transport